MDMAEKMKKTKVHLFLTRTAIDILEHKTKVWLRTMYSSSDSDTQVYDTLIHSLLFSVHAVLLRSALGFILCSPSVSAQNPGLHSQTPSGRHAPLLHLPEQEVCEFWKC